MGRNMYLFLNTYSLKLHLSDSCVRLPTFLKVHTSTTGIAKIPRIFGLREKNEQICILHCSAGCLFSLTCLAQLNVHFADDSLSQVSILF